jgi:hypothetical protein
VTWGLVSIFVGIQKKNKDIWFGLARDLRVNNNMLNIIIGVIFFTAGLLIDIFF